MKNNKFWDKCDDDSIRKKVAEFIDKTPAVSRLKNKDFYDFEDALINFLYENREMISKEVDLEYQRQDILDHAKEEFGDDAEEALQALPIEVIDDLIGSWQLALNENEDYWDIFWSELSNVLTDGGLSPLAGIKTYPTEKILLYVAYLKEWYSDMPPEMIGQKPTNIDEFFANEMADKELSDYYIKAAKNLFVDKFKKK